MLDPGHHATGHTPQPGWAVPKRPWSTQAAQRLSGCYPEAIRIVQLRFPPESGAVKSEPIFKKSLVLDWRSVTFTKMTSWFEWEVVYFDKFNWLYEWKGCTSTKTQLSFLCVFDRAVPNIVVFTIANFKNIRQPLSEPYVLVARISTIWPLNRNPTSKFQTVSFKSNDFYYVPPTSRKRSFWGLVIQQ